MRPSRFAFAAALATATLGVAPTPSRAAPPHAPHRAHGRRPLERVAPGPALSPQPSLSGGGAPLARRAAERFAAREGGAWHVTWDDDAGRPQRVFGGGVAAPGAVDDEGVALRLALEVVARELDLLAPGSSVSDLALASSRARRGTRSLVLQQSRLVDTSTGPRRVRVEGATVSVRFAHDRLTSVSSSAVPFGPRATPLSVARLGADEAAAAALEEAAAEGAPADVAVTASELVVTHARVAGRRALEVSLAHRVELRSASEPFAAAYYVDAASGDVLLRRELIVTATGSIAFDSPMRNPQSERALFAASRLDLELGASGALDTTDAEGLFEWDGAPVDVTFGARGDRVRVQNLGGDPAATSTQAIADGAAALTWSLADDEHGDAQLTTYVHLELGKTHASAIDPTMPFVSALLTARVNRSEPEYLCNAYWDGFTVNFFVESGSCNNTGRLPDVVYHELGHAFHTYAIEQGEGAMDPALGEGQADFFAMSLTNDPHLAPGFHKSGEPLREALTVRRWPDDISWDPHSTGLIFAGAMWELRERLRAELGDEAGHDKALELYLGIVARASNLPDTFAEALLTDDDDGDLSNGTPNGCAIQAAFSRHGLSPWVGPTALVLEHQALGRVPSSEVPRVRVSTTALMPECGDGAAPTGLVRYRAAGPQKTAPLVDAGDGVLEATLEEAPRAAGIRYRIELETTSGEELTLPRTYTGDEYWAYYGDVDEVWCTGFEDGADGWTVGSGDDDQNDFEWGSPLGLAGDPVEAFGGTKVLGNDLGALDTDGAYYDDMEAVTVSPRIAWGQEARPRLQLYRWLSIEGGGNDRARIELNGSTVWSSSGALDEGLLVQDGEWRFMDLDVSPFIVRDDDNVLSFRLTSDGDVEGGGWTIDDVCLVSVPFEASTGGGGAGGEGEPAATPLTGPSGCGCRLGDERGTTPASGGALGALGLGVLGLGALGARARGRRRRVSASCA